MTNEVITTVVPYEYSDLGSFDYYSAEMARDYSRWGKVVEIRSKSSESLGLSDGIDYTSLKMLERESIQVKDTYSFSCNLLEKEPLNLSDSVALNVLRSEVENLSLSDDHTLRVNRHNREFLSLIDADEKNPSTILYDLEFSNFVESNESFTEYVNDKTPLNYTPIRQLIPGEYEYKNAIVGVQMSIPPTEGRFGIIGSTLHVDVQDTVEKGTIELVDSTSVVTFSKKFYKEVKIFTSIVESEEPAVVEQSNITLDGFTIALKAQSDRNRSVSGTVDWLADGF